MLILISEGKKKPFKNAPDMFAEESDMFSEHFDVSCLCFLREILEKNTRLQSKYM